MQELAFRQSRGGIQGLDSEAGGRWRVEIAADAKRGIGRSEDPAPLVPSFFLRADQQIVKPDVRWDPRRRWLDPGHDGAEIRCHVTRPAIGLAAQADMGCFDVIARLVSQGTKQAKPICQACYLRQFFTQTHAGDTGWHAAIGPPNVGGRIRFGIKGIQVTGTAIKEDKDAGFIASPLRLRRIGAVPQQVRKAQPHRLEEADVAAIAGGQAGCGFHPSGHSQPLTHLCCWKFLADLLTNQS